MAGSGSPPNARSTCSATAAGGRIASSPPSGTGSLVISPSRSTSITGSSTHHMSSACAAASRSTWAWARWTKAGNELLVVVDLEGLLVAAFAGHVDAGRRMRGGVGDEAVALALEVPLGDQLLDRALDVLARPADRRGHVVEPH